MPSTTPSSSTTPSPAPRPRRPPLVWVLFAVMILQGISSLPAGALMVLDPSGGLMKSPVSMLEGSPFADFLVPGLLLGGVLGLGAFFVAAVLLARPGWGWARWLNPFKRRHWAWSAALVYGFGLIVWIAVEVAMIGLTSWLQPLYLGVALVILLLALAPSVRRHLAAE